MRKHWAHLNYVTRHKWYVFWECLKLGVPIWRALFHDWTKFLPCEWFPYAEFFNGNMMSREKAAALNYEFPVADDVELAFEQAWNHHQKKNDHHWQFWVRLGDDGTTLTLPMPDNARKEMIADWRGAGKALGKPDTGAWYRANFYKMKLHDDTRKQVELELFGETIVDQLRQQLDEIQTQLQQEA